MNKNLLQLKKEFGKYGSWALWDNFGRFFPLLNKDNFGDLIKPNIVFLGLNASRELRNDWVNFHQEGMVDRIKTWSQDHVKWFVDVIMEDEFSFFQGAYMTDIIKDHFDSESSIIGNKTKSDKSIISKNLELFRKELNLLSKISGEEKFKIICIGGKVFNTLNSISEFYSSGNYQIFQIWHYAAYQLGREGVKERIRQDLREIIKL